MENEGKREREAEWRFASLRGFAMTYYATLEQSLCGLFAALSDTTPNTAATIFFKITNTRSRMTILDKLFKAKVRGYRAFWNSVSKEVGQLDQKRNEIVHWAVSVDISDGRPGLEGRRFVLIPPNFWSDASESPELDDEALMVFMDRCDVFARALNMFVLACLTQPSEPVLQSWRDTCLEPLKHPIPADHPLARTDRASLIPPAPVHMKARQAPGPEEPETES